MRWFFVFFLSARLFANSFENISPSAPEEILSLTSDLLIDGFISPSSGQISIIETDLFVRGAQDLFLKRTYIPPQILGRYKDKEKEDRLYLGKALRQLESKGWVINPHLWAGYNGLSKFFQVRDPQGFVLEFEILGNKGILRSSSYGCSNLRGEEPSSQADIRNIELIIKDKKVIITWPDGTERVYSNQNSYLYQLEKEILPNGKQILYEYLSSTPNTRKFLKISSTDPTGHFVYASITQVDQNRYVGSDGTVADFIYDEREVSGKIKKKRSEEKIQLQCDRIR